MNLVPQPRRAEWDDTARCDIARSVESQVSAEGGEDWRRPQGYRLELSPDAIRIEAGDEAGAFYARQTLAQIARQADQPGSVPCGVIEDWPDFAHRGVMLDISRDKVPTMDELFAWFGRLAEIKINQVQLYTEHTFAYPGHERVWGEASPMTGEQIEALDAFCRERFIELVPNQNCFGHLERWFEHERYQPLAEMPALREDDDVPDWFRGRGPTTLNPADPASVDFVAELLDALLPHFSSGQVHIGCDETYDVGYGRSRPVAEKIGRDRLYLQFLKQVDALCVQRGRRAQFWGDIVLEHPELVGELPDNLIAMNWGYEKDHPFERETRAFAEAGVPFYVCPSTSTFAHMTGRVETMLVNQREATRNGLAQGAIGVLNTIWGDYGHWQPSPADDPGLYFGAAVAWCGDTNHDLDLAAALSVHRYHDPTGRLAEGVLQLGRLERDLPQGWPAQLKHSLLNPEVPFKNETYGSGNGRHGKVSDAMLQAARDRLADGLSLIDRSRPGCDDAAWLAPELHVAAALTDHALRNLLTRSRHGCARTDGLTEAEREALAEHLRPLLEQHRACWLKRNRPGGLRESVGRLERLLASYA